LRREDEEDMRVLKLNVEGFRSLKGIEWEPGALNVLIGPNASGKSNLLRLLELVSVSSTGKLGKHIQRAGGMEPLLWDGRANGIHASVKMSPIDEDRDPVRDSLTYQLDLVRIGLSSSYRIEYEVLGNFYRKEIGESDQPFKNLERRQLVGKVFDQTEHGLVAPEESLSEEESLLSLAAGPFSNNRLIPPVQAFLAGWSIYHDVHVNQDAAIRKPAVARHELRVDPDGQNLISALHTLYTGDRDFKKDINLAMRAAFGEDFDELVFPPAADQLIQLKVRWKSLKREQSARDLSDGTLRFLMLLTILASPSPPTIIAIDEPETGLHPSMLPIVAEYATDASLRTQVILTTHSPQFLDAFGDTRPTTTVVKWAEGQTVLDTMDDTVLSGWLKEYSLGALYKSGELEQGLERLDAGRDPQATDASKG
jgi:predicted ATPase